MNLFLIVLIIIQIQIDARIICKSPNKQYLDAIYSEYLSVFRKYEEKIFENKIQISNDKLLEKSIDLEESLSIENTQCNFNQKNRLVS